MGNGFKRIIYILVCCITFSLAGCGNGNSQPVQSQKNTSGNEVKTVAQKINPIPENFISVSVLNRTLYVPKEIEKRKIPTQNPNLGVAFSGSVYKQDDAEKDYRKNRFEVNVMYEKAADLKRMRPSEEERILETIFENFWRSMKQNAKVATRHELIYKKIQRNRGGHLYLKAEYISGNPARPNLDMRNKMALYIFDEMIYYINVDQMVIANKKFDAETDNILDTFDVR